MTWRGSVFATLLIAASAAACSGSRSAAPAWPKLHDTEVDGGESLEPRPKTQVAAAVATSDDKTPAPAEAPVAPVVAPVVAPAVTAPTTVAPEEVITTEDIVIEVDE